MPLVGMTAISIINVAVGKVPIHLATCVMY